eukprot:g2259.t1
MFSDTDVNFLVGYEAGHQLTESERGDVGFTRVEQLEQWFLASAPGNPVLLRSLEILKEKFLWKIRETVELTGPATFSDAVHEFLAEAVADGVLPALDLAQSDLQAIPARALPQALLELIFSSDFVGLTSRLAALVGATWTGPSLDIAQAPPSSPDFNFDRWEGVMEKLPGWSGQAEEPKQVGEEIFAAFRFGRPEEEQMSFTEFIMVLICCARGTAAQKATALFELFADAPRPLPELPHRIPISRAAQGLAEPQDEEAVAAAGPACVTLPPSKSPAVLEIEVWANDYGLLAGYVCVRSLWPFTSLKCLDNEELRRRGLPFVVWSSRDPAAACRVGELHLGISWAPRNQQKPQVGTLSLCVNRLRLFDQAAEMEALELPRPSLKAFALDQDGQRRPIVRQGQRGFAQMDGLLRAWAYQPFQSLSWISKDFSSDNSWTWGRDLLHSTNDLRMAVPALPRCREVISLQRCRQVAEVLVRRSSLYLTAWQVVQLADRCFHRAGHSFALLDALLLPGLEVPPQQPGWRRYCDESGRQYLDVTPQLSMVLERQLSDGGRRLRLQGLETLQLTDPFPDLSKILWLRFLRPSPSGTRRIVEMDSDATLHVLTKEEFISCILAHPELSEPLRRHSYLALDALGALTLDVMVEWTAAQYLPVLFGDGQGLAVGGHSRFEDGAGHEIKVFGSDTIWDFLEKLKSACQVLALKLQRDRAPQIDVDVGTWTRSLPSRYRDERSASRAEALSKKYQAVAGSGQHEVYAFVPPTSNPKDSLEAVVKAHGDTSSWQILDKDCTFQSYAGLLKHHGMPPCLKVQWKR